MMWRCLFLSFFHNLCRFVLKIIWRHTWHYVDSFLLKFVYNREMIIFLFISFVYTLILFVLYCLDFYSIRLQFLNLMPPFKFCTFPSWAQFSNAIRLCWTKKTFFLNGCGMRPHTERLPAKLFLRWSVLYCSYQQLVLALAVINITIFFTMRQLSQNVIQKSKNIEPLSYSLLISERIGKKKTLRPLLPQQTISSLALQGASRHQSIIV